MAEIIGSHDAMRLNNQLNVLRAIRKLEPVLRKDLQRKTHLSWGTIQSCVKSLIDRSMVSETRKEGSGVGRKALRIEMDKSSRYIVGLRLGGAVVRALLTNIAGHIVVPALSVPLDPNAGKEVILDHMFSALESVLEGVKLSRDRISGIGIAVPGAIDARKGICLSAPHHPQWIDVPVKQIFVKRYRMPCFVDHVNNCAALAEKWYGNFNAKDSFLCVLLGTGISTGIVIDGKVYRGTNYAAGELGHICIDPQGPRCVCGRRGCLEVYASGLAISMRAIEAAKTNPESLILKLAAGSLDGITAEVAYRAAKSGDNDALRIFEEVGYYLGVGISDLINLFNPEAIVLCGGVARASELFLPAIERTVGRQAWVAAKKNIRVSSLDNPATLGAACTVLEEIYERGLLIKKNS